MTAYWRDANSDPPEDDDSTVLVYLNKESGGSRYAIGYITTTRVSGTDRRLRMWYTTCDEYGSDVYPIRWCRFPDKPEDVV